MTTRYVALDTETTGRDADADEIIEVGAIAFTLDGVVGEYQTLVRPQRLPEYQIERLTGIRAADLGAAPHFAAVAQEVREFIGDSPIVGQSVAFDYAFLQKAGVWPTGPAIDTFELALLLLPGLHDYSLRGLAAHLGIDFPVRHRALADADAARSVFLALRDRMAALPRWLLEEVARLALAANWSVATVAYEVLESAASPSLPSPPLRRAERGPGGEVSGLLTNDVLARPTEIPRALQQMREGRREVDEREVLSLLAAAGNLHQHFEDTNGSGRAFERRPQQEEMAVAVAAALNARRHLIAEAGTGTGKSLAYLLPAALHALRTGERVVVSTDTIGLQEQLFAKDLPVVQDLIERHLGQDLRVAQLKGRPNYLCLQRWTAARYQPPANPDDAQLQARLLVWLTQTQTGDRAEMGLHSSMDASWARLSSENTACLTNGCPFVRDGTCFLSRARRRAEAAHILVVNHALLLSDIATGGHVLPGYSRLVIDEAHNLEDEATSRLAFRAQEGDIIAFLDRVGRRAGDRGSLVHSLSESARGTGQLMGPATYLAGVGSALVDAGNRARTRVSEPYRLLARVLRELSPPEADSDSRMLITRSTRVQPLWSDVQIAAENLHLALNHLITLLEDLRGLLESGDHGLINQEALLAEAGDLLQAGYNFSEGIGHAILREDPDLICWLERDRNSGEVAVCTAPLRVSEILRRELFDQKDTIVLTSATLSSQSAPVQDRDTGELTTSGLTFDYLRERVGLDDADELLVGSPFDYQKSTLMLIPRDLPEPGDRDFARETGELLVEACRASQGRALMLFTSYSSLMGVYDQIKAPLESEGILVLAHGVDGSPRQLLSSLRENNRTVILGTASFWEGVDIAGEALSLLVIARLPFAVPTDPIYQARSALYDQPFEEYALPQAVLRFRQGFGRLIRSKTDRGVLLLLDKRVRARRYGESFLKALPRATVRDLMGREVAGAIETWLA